MYAFLRSIGRVGAEIPVKLSRIIIMKTKTKQKT